MFDLTGKGALVTGATGGIGGAIAKALHAQGANVAISGTKAERLEALAAELGSRVFVLPCDLRDRRGGGAASPTRRRRRSARSISSSTMPASPTTISSCA